MTNAIRHARSSFWVSVLRTERGVRVAASDASPVEPVIRDARGTASGRGMRLVAALSSSWGVEAAPEGKIVWAELRP